MHDAAASHPADSIPAEFTRGRPRHPWHRSRPHYSLVFAAILVLPLLLPGATSGAQAARFDGMLAFGGYHVGAFVTADGSRAYCLEPGADAPLSPQLEPTRVSSLPGYAITVHDGWGWSGEVRTSPASGEQLRQMNWILTERGDTSDADLAAAVQIALWEIRREPGNEEWIDAKYALFARHGGEPHIAAGHRIAAEARSSALGPGHAQPGGELEMLVGDPQGKGGVSYPRGTTKLSITGGRFADGSTSVSLDGQSAGALEWIAHPHEPAWTRMPEVIVSGRWSVAERFWPAELILHPATRDTEQRIGAGVEPARGENAGEFDPVRAAFDARFAPTISTLVPDAIVRAGDGVFRDRVTVASATGPWPSRRDGEAYLPVLADGTLFGPFSARARESSEPPDGAPVAARTTLAMSGGPGDYEAVVTLPDPSPGYYYWLWEIREDSQTEEVRASGVFPAGARYADRFGVADEQQLVPMALRVETRLVQRLVTPDSRVLEDRVRVTLSGGGDSGGDSDSGGRGGGGAAGGSGSWVRSETGERLPARLRLTFYQTDEPPKRQPSPPAGARELGSVWVTVTEPGVWIDAPAFTVPDVESGWVTVQACVLAADQPQGVADMFEATCDDFGVPEETARIATQLAPTGGGQRAELFSGVQRVALTAGMLGLGGLLAGLSRRRRGPDVRGQRSRVLR